MADLTVSVNTCASLEKVYVVSLIGIIDNLTANIFRDEITKIIENSIPKVLVLDMSELIFINSTGIGSLFEFAEKLKLSHGKMVFTHLRPNIDDTFSVMGIHSVFPVYDSNQEAFDVLEKTQ